MPRRNDISDGNRREQTVFRQDSAPPSYEDAINPNGKLKFFYKGRIMLVIFRSTSNIRFIIWKSP